MSPGFWLTLVLIHHLITETISDEDLKCEVRKNSTATVYKCPINNKQNVEIIFNKSPTVITIKCNEIDIIDETIFPEINFGRGFTELCVKNCPPMPNGFQEIFKKLHIKKLKRLKLYTKLSNKSIEIQNFRGLISIESLLLGSTITNLDGNIFKLTPNLTTLDLRNNNVFPYDDLFKHSPQLVILNLSRNNIKHLPDTVFRSLVNLKFLYLKYNKISIIEMDTFRDLVLLEDLRLDNNLLLRFDENALRYQKKLRILSLNYNKLGNITEKLLENCEHFEIIHISNNDKLVLKNDVFAHFFLLNYITLKYDNLMSLPKNLFNGSQNLIEINLEHNNLNNLPRDIFKNLEFLSELYLNNNKIETLDQDIFTSLINLRFLTLHQNLLSSIDEGSFKGLENLGYLDLSSNRIYTVHSDLFARKYSLIGLWINRNNLNSTEFFSTNIKDCINIKMLNFDHNRISRFPYKMLEILLNRSIPQDGNMLYQEEVSSTIRIFLRNNSISEIKRSLLSTYNSTSKVSVRVDISQNPIHCNCLAFDLIPRRASNHNSHIKIEYDNLFCASPIKLLNTHIRDIDENELFCSLKRNCTRRNECECFYKPAYETTVIDCSKKNLSDIPRVVLDNISEHFDFFKLNKVEVHLEDNLLERGPTEHDGYRNISALYLQRNKIQFLEWLPPYVEVLNLENNQLESISSEILNLLNESIIGELKLNNNPWKCDCTTKDFMSYLRTHSTMVGDATDIRCQALGKSLIILDEEEICPVRAVFTSVLISVILIFFIIISGIVFMYYLYREEILIWLYARGSCLCLIKEERLDKNKKYDAFVSFAHQDEDFVMDRLLPILELGVPQYKFCVHVRDWIPGEYIATQISNSVRDSRRTLIILSPNFIKSVWGRMEFRTAHTSAMKEGRVRIILVIYGDVDMDQLDEELKAYIKTNTYIEWGDPWFWEKLRYALPRTRQIQKKPKLTRGRSDQSNIELN